MTLAGSPRSSLFPGSDIFPGSRALFYTPTENLAFRMEGGLFGKLPHAMSVWRVNGTWSHGFAPSAETVAAADRFYRGGYRHLIDGAEADELTAAGYGANITQEST